MPAHLSRRPVQSMVEAVNLRDGVAYRLSRINMQRLGFSKRQETEALVQIAIGQDDAGDGSVAQGSRMQRREPCQLCADVRRRMDQEPAIVAARECDGRLFARSGRDGAG